MTRWRQPSASADAESATRRPYRRLFRRYGSSGPGQPTRKPTGSPFSLAAVDDATRQQCRTSGAYSLARWEVAEVVLRLLPGMWYRT